MSILNKLATSLNRRDEVPNQELAAEIAAKNNKAAIRELIDNLSNKSKDIQHDCIKVLYEAGERKPELITGYLETFLELLHHKNNRLQWGAMTALHAIALKDPKIIYHSLSKIMDAADKGSVITRDYAVKILIQLSSVKQYADDTFLLLNEQLLGCPSNQFPMYAEYTASVITEKNKKIFIHTITSRLKDLEKDSQRKRIEKIIKKLS